MKGLVTASFIEQAQRSKSPPIHIHNNMIPKHIKREWVPYICRTGRSDILC